MHQSVHSQQQEEEMQEDLLVTGQVHHCDVLMDFPHPREYCARHPFSRCSPRDVPLDGGHPNQAACENCFCYVCNAPAMTCPEWLKHCHGYHSSPAWRAIRDARRLQSQAAILPASPQPGTPRQRPTDASVHQPAGASAPLSAAALHCHVIDDDGEHGHTRETVESLGAELTCSRLLEQVQQVWPEEAPPPPLLTVERLRPYQKQSLAFALARERAADATGCGSGGWICDEVGMGKTIVCIAIVLANPMSPDLAATGASWSVLTKFKQRCEAKGVPVMEPPREIKIKLPGDRFGHHTMWRREPNPLHVMWQKVAQPARHHVIHTKTTLVMTPVSLLGQWKDELKKFAPTLSVLTCHSSFNQELTLLQTLSVDLCDVDVLLVSTKCNLPPLIHRHVRFHRVIVDESHSGLPNENGRHCQWLPDLNINHRWLCTATPFTASLNELTAGIRFLRKCNHPVIQAELNTLLNAINKHHSEVSNLNLSLADSHHRLYATGVLSPPKHPTKPCPFLNPNTKSHIGRKAFTFYSWPQEKAPLPGYVDTVLPVLRAIRQEVVICLQAVMIRHTKAQQIGGEVALTLPPLDLDTEFIPMAADEQQRYSRAVREELEEGRLQRQLAAGVTSDVGLQQSLALRMSVCSSAQTKLEALVSDVQQLRAAEPHMHCVVFTQHRGTHEKVTERLQQEGVQVYKFSGDTTVAARHAYIRKFQAMEPVPKAFVAIVRQGNCGVTLTAATRVYLMEPCINPALEVQAAGRVHRLGQLRGVLIKRYAMKDTFEENIVNLHLDIRAGITTMFHKRVTKELIEQIVSK